MKNRGSSIAGQTQTSSLLRARHVPPAECAARAAAHQSQNESWVPALEGAVEIVVEDLGADLEQEVRSAGCPAHLLFLDHPFADDLVHGGVDERVGDRLAAAVALAVVGDPGGVGVDVVLELRRGPCTACAAAGWGPRRRGRSSGPRSRGGRGRRCRARGTHLARSSSSTAARALRGSRPLIICPRTVRRIVMWNQSIRCSACGLRYSGSSRASARASATRTCCWLIPSLKLACAGALRVRVMVSREREQSGKSVVVGGD